MITSCIDWESRIVAGESIIPPPIFPDMAEKALSIFRLLRVPDLPGKPTFAEVSEPWVFDFVAAVFGAYNEETGEQMIREFFLLISKKNSKSTLAAGIMLTAFILCWREEEEHLILAPTKEVADAAFNPAAGMIRADDELRKIFNVKDYIRTIEHRVNHNVLKIVAADSKTATGKKAGRILIDEIHEFGKMHNADTVFMEATGGLVARPEGFVIYLSTQSDESPAGVFKEKLDYFRGVRDGRIDDSRVLPVLYEFPRRYLDEKLYENTDNFYITNPNLGRSVSAEWLEDNMRKAQHGDPGTYQKFLAKHLNIQIGLNLAHDRWSGADHWELASAGHSHTLDELIERSEVIDIGIDGGGLDDLMGLYVIGRTPEGSKLGWGYAWCSSTALERRKEIAPRLRDFQAAGEMTIIDRIGQDVDELVDLCDMIKESDKLDKIGIDPAGVGAILDELEKRGFTESDIVGVSQGWRLGGAIKTAERWLATEGMFSPANQAIMSWCAGNAKVEPRANSIMITKQKSGSAKIDPLMAMFNAVTLMSLNPPAPAGKLKMYFL